MHSSKGLEKDEREAMECSFRRSEPTGWKRIVRLGSPSTRIHEWQWFQAGWVTAKAHFEARLQQAEAEAQTTKEAHLRLNMLYRSSREELGKEQNRVENLETELSIARKALENISETYILGDPNPVASANHLQSLARSALARLKAKRDK
jgi:hypothetical protein